ncbi:methyltransferase domain-containing protein [Verminephrobacter aporrectodeae subsp. tuberculatae]|uniref:O-methyltransferase n=1 Tax=Verminephrobacter aporrectodeae TaxID=1110389 RepID=UPI00224410BD|nr:class I SAM-dependent methyltransferase [Verminephrobacter aporrectodeae]MCW8206073.1 methyltransferase domain-containing protein [Verminephrobacter aporrectodeae subsp. tuberculatae]
MKNLNCIRPPETFDAIAWESKARAFDMPSEVGVNALLRTLAAVKPAGHCLELGTGTGLASTWLLDGLGPHGRLTTVDNEPKWLEVARAYLGKDPRVDIVCADGDEFLRRASEHSTRYDLIFADTWSGKYRLLDLALNLLAPAGMYVIDDMLPQSNWPEGHEAKVQLLMEELAQRPRLQICSLPWSCGVVIATKF